MVQGETGHGGRNRSRPHCVRSLDGDQLPPKRDTAPSSPQFSAHVRYDVTKRLDGLRSLGMEVGLCPGDIVLGGDPAPPKGAQPSTPNLRRLSVVAKRLDGARCHLVWR